MSRANPSKSTSDSGEISRCSARSTSPNPSWRIWALNSPFDLKDVLKARGYHWNGDGNPNPRAWYIDVDEDVREQELAYLRAEIYQREVDILVRKITAYERFSDRS